MARVLTVCRHPAGSAEPLEVGSVRVDVPRPGSRTGRHSQRPPGQRPCSQPTFPGLLARDWQAQPPFVVIGEPGPRHSLDTARGRGWLSQRAGVCTADSSGRGRGAAQPPQARVHPSLPPCPCCGTDGGGAVGYEAGGAGRDRAVRDRWAPGPGGFACTLTAARSHTCRPGCVATCIWRWVTADTQQDPVPVLQGAWPPRSLRCCPSESGRGCPGLRGHVQRGL